MRNNSLFINLQYDHDVLLFSQYRTSKLLQFDSNT